MGPRWCKIKGVFDYYSVMNNWHRSLLVLLFGIYSRSGFEMIGFTGESQVLLFHVTGQTGQCVPVRPAVIERSDRPGRGLTGRRCVSFGFGLFVWISVIIS